MSYILDALKRAEVERERGAVPGLHSRPVVSYDEVNDAPSLTWVWALAAVVLFGAAGAGFWWWRTPTPAAPVKEPTPITTAPVTEAPVATAALPPTQPIASITPTAVLVPAAPTAILPSTPAPVVAPPPEPKPAIAKPKPTPALGPKPTPVPIPAPSKVAATPVIPGPAPMPTLTPAPVAALPTPTAANPPRTASQATGSGIPMLSELPDALRRQIPALSIAGAVYSDDPSLRVLLVNNQAFGQGNVVAPGVQLEEIQPNNSVFNFQGTRFQLGH